MLRGLEPLASPSLTAAEEHNVKLGMTKPRREGITRIRLVSRCRGCRLLNVLGICDK